MECQSLKAPVQSSPAAWCEQIFIDDRRKHNESLSVYCKTQRDRHRESTIPVFLTSRQAADSGEEKRKVVVELDVWRNRQTGRNTNATQKAGKCKANVEGGGLGEPATLYIGVKEIKSNYAGSNSPLRKLGGVC